MGSCEILVHDSQHCLKASQGVTGRLRNHRWCLDVRGFQIASSLQSFPKPLFSFRLWQSGVSAPWGPSGRVPCPNRGIKTDIVHIFRQNCCGNCHQVKMPISENRPWLRVRVALFFFKTVRRFDPHTDGVWLGLSVGSSSSWASFLPSPSGPVGGGGYSLSSGESVDVGRNPSLLDLKRNVHMVLGTNLYAAVAGRRHPRRGGPAGPLPVLRLLCLQDGPHRRAPRRGDHCPRIGIWIAICYPSWPLCFFSLMFVIHLFVQVSSNGRQKPPPPLPPRNLSSDLFGRLLTPQNFLGVTIFTG